MTTSTVLFKSRLHFEGILEAFLKPAESGYFYDLIQISNNSVL